MEGFHRVLYVKFLDYHPEAWDKGARLAMTVKQRPGTSSARLPCGLSSQALWP